VDLADRLELARVGGAEDRDHADRVLVDALHHLFGIDDEAVGRDRYVARFHVPVLAELLPHDLHVRTEHQVGPVSRLAARRGALPSSNSSSWISRYTPSGLFSCSGIRFFGTGVWLRRPAYAGERSPPSESCLCSIRGLCRVCNGAAPPRRGEHAPRCRDAPPP